MMKKSPSTVCVSTSRCFLLFGLVVIGSASSLFAQSEPPLGDLTNVFYNPDSGEVFIDILSDDILQVNFISLKEDSSPGDLLIPDNVNRTNALGLKSTARTTDLIAFDGGDDGMQVFSLPSGRFSIGNVLPTNLLLAFDSNLNVTRASLNGQNRDLLALNLVGRGGINQFRGVNLVSAVPEPGSACLLLLGATGFLLRRKK